ncbi:DNA-directed RNA polymerase sigma-70 factor [Marivirga lumbricoides]|uniref:DNA-directed RNA polymerase sigma-70 factor n=1 Tax=Marivirga lumbricoides TaxID=1046115 RepID=A0ABQ1M9J0_9BACT|nr:DNA-directed RNA polymerase sigma-70 factor [Marivirga lumbricoides]
MNNLQDFDLWNRLRAGDSSALDVIFDKHVRLLYSYGYRISKNKALVEDCIQNLFIYLWENRQTIGETYNIKFYLMRSLQRSIVKEVNKESKLRQDFIPENYDFEIAFSHEFQLINNQLSQDRKEQLRIALDLLSNRQREVLYHKFFNHLTYVEISVIMDMNVNSVYNLVCRAMQTLSLLLKSNKTLW